METFGIGQYEKSSGIHGTRSLHWPGRVNLGAYRWQCWARKDMGEAYWSANLRVRIIYRPHSCLLFSLPEWLPHTVKRIRNYLLLEWSCTVAGEYLNGAGSPRVVFILIWIYDRIFTSTPLYRVLENSIWTFSPRPTERMGMISSNFILALSTLIHIGDQWANNHRTCTCF